MNTLVTGGAGFIGSTLVDRLLTDGHRVSVIDDLSRGKRENLVAAGRRVNFVEQDIRHPELFDAVQACRPEVIFHLAAQIDVRHSVADPAYDASINILGTLNVAEAARRAGVRKIVFTSSGGSIYGNPEQLPVNETQAVSPQSPYAVSKVAGELYLNSYSQLHGLQCTHLALANVYGPRQDPSGEAGVVAIFAESMLNGHSTKLFGDGGNTRDYVFVEDVVSAIIAAAGQRSDRKRFNIGTGVQTSDRELHALIASCAGAPDSPRFVPARLGDLRASALNSALARSELGWAQKFSLSEGIRATVDHFRRRL